MIWQHSHQALSIIPCSDWSPRSVKEGEMRNKMSTEQMSEEMRTRAAVGEWGTELSILLYNFGHVARSNRHDLINSGSQSLVLPYLFIAIYFAVIAWHRVTSEAIGTSAQLSGAQARVLIIYTSAQMTEQPLSIPSWPFLCRLTSRITENSNLVVSVPWGENQQQRRKKASEEETRDGIKQNGIN